MLAVVAAVWFSPPRVWLVPLAVTYGWLRIELPTSGAELITVC
jgi:hypothetical protein